MVHPYESGGPIRSALNFSRTGIIDLKPARQARTSGVVW